MLDKRFLILSLRAPNTLAPGSYAWFAVNFTPQEPNINFEQAQASLKTLIAFISEAVSAYEANPEQVYLIGFSQGAIMSGRILPEIRPLIATSEQLNGLPVLVVHGTEDTVLPISHGRASRDLLSSLPVALTYHEYPTGHEVSPRSLNDVNKWLSEQLDRG